MRYYEIKITSSSQSSSFAPITYSTVVSNGNNNGSALHVELDIFQTFFHQPAQVGSVVIYGVDYAQINQSLNLTNANIQIAVGMSKGLPFANKSQQGVIINGTILQAFGNWQGDLVSLNLLIIPSTVSPDENINLSFNWEKGKTLESAVRTTLTTAYPNLGVFGKFSDNLVFTETQPAQYFTLRTFCNFVTNVSKQLILASNYLGACVSVGIGGFVLTDGTTPVEKVTEISFTDLVGNLTWIDVATIQVKVVMRADLTIGNKIKLPTGAPTTNTATNYNQARSLTTFNGEFLVTQIRYVGASRSPDANAWVTVINCVIP